MACLVACESAALAEPPQTSEDADASSRRVEQSKPQIIYHLSNGSRDTAEALHAQSKRANENLEVSPDMPISLQLARASSNASPAQLPPNRPPNPSVDRRIGAGAGRGAKMRGPSRGGEGRRSFAKPAKGGRGEKHGHGH